MITLVPCNSFERIWSSEFILHTLFLSDIVIVKIESERNGVPKLHEINLAGDPFTMFNMSFLSKYYGIRNQHLLFEINKVRKPLPECCERY